MVAKKRMFDVRFIKVVNGKRVGKYTKVKSTSQKAAVAKFLKAKGKGSGYKIKRSKPKVNSNSPLNLIGQSTKALVGVTALGITANALTEIGKNH
jgi:hypothetical protein